MTLYKLNVEHRNYANWNVVNANTLEIVTLDNFNPIEHKLFNGDVFTFNKGRTEIIHSSIRLNENIPAVLILADNKTYGREHRLESGKTYTKKRVEGKLLYKCIPDDIRIPAFLVPYEIKQMGFSKVFNNLYVTISFKQWDDKHPHAILSQSIGPVDVLDNFYEYQLYCKSLNISIQKFNKDTNKALKTFSEQKDNEHNIIISSICKKYPQIEDRTSWKTFTIDPATSLDYDDGFSIKKLNDNQTLLSIYIANVAIWLDTLNLWPSFSQRISTIYLPDRKRPMLPTILSDSLCSLQSNARRFAFVMDVIIDEFNNITSISFTNAIINVFKNFAYEEPQLLDDFDYNSLFNITQKLSKKYKYITNIKDSHDVVSYLMILMNYHCAKDLYASHSGIFRSTIIKKSIELPTNLPDDVNQFIKIWNSSSTQYIDINNIRDDIISTRHDALDMDAYIHITSPIRRLVDLLNIIKFQNNHSLLTFSDEALNFYNKWTEQIDYINTTMRSIRKVQTDCALLDMCMNNPEVLQKKYDGFCFDKLVRNDGLYQYMVYLPEIKLATRITMRDNIDNYDKREFSLYLFNDEEKFKRKIRLQLV